MANVNKIAKFLKDSVEELIKIDEGCCELKLDDDLSLFVGWSGGYDNQPDDTIIQSKNDPEYAINAGIKSNHEYLKTDFDWLNYPYEEESGEVWDSGITISPNEDYEKDAQWFVDQYAEIRTALDKGEIVLESKKVENVYKSEDITFQEIEARMDNAEDYADLYEAASLIADTSLRIDVENLIGQCEDDEDTIDEAVSIICSDLLDAYANEENVEHFEESKKVGEKKLQEDWAEDVDFVADYVLANVDGKDNVEFEDLRNIIHDGLKEFYPEMSEEELEDKESDIEPDIRTILSLNGYGTDFVTGNVTTDIDSLEEGKKIEEKDTKQEYQDYCKDLKIDANKKSSVNKFLNDYAQNYTKMNGVSNLQSEIDRVKKELRESISKKVEAKVTDYIDEEDLDKIVKENPNFKDCKNYEAVEDMLLKVSTKGYTDFDTSYKVFKGEDGKFYAYKLDDENNKVGDEFYLFESKSKKVEAKEEYTLDNIDDAIHEVRSKIAKQRAYDRRRDAVCLSIGDDDAVYKPMYDELKRTTSKEIII